MRIVLVEPYFGGSHRAWAEGLQRFTAHEVELVTMPARFWKWRMAGGAVTLADLARVSIGRRGRPDLLLATSMVNLPALLGLVPELAGVPVALYMHENQLGYPPSPRDRPDLTYPMINWLSTVAATRVFFNSEFHLEQWYRELPPMLKGFPDFTHGEHVEEVRQRSSVLPVGIDLRRFDAAEPIEIEDGPPTIVWNQRWDHDKNPTGFFAALEGVRAPFRLVLLGESVGADPDGFRRLAERFETLHFGFAEPGSYERWLKTADVVVSTANQEYFGIAVAEAIYAGCRPVLPNRLSYPWLIPDEHHAAVLYGAEDSPVRMLEAALADPTPPAGLADAMSRFDWAELIERYDRELALVAGGR